MYRFSGLPNMKHKKRAAAIAIACGILLTLPSCIPDLRHPMPGPNLPDTFVGAATPDNSSQVTIEDFFNDPILTSLIHQALYGNLELKILAEDMQIASNQILARQGAYLPFLSPASTVGMNRFSKWSLDGASLRDDAYSPGSFIRNPFAEVAVGGFLYWTPDIWWQLHNAKDAAAMRYFASGEGRKYVVTTVIAEIADNYYGLLSLDKRLENLDNIIALQEQSLRFAQLAKDFARGTDLAVRRFEAEVRKNQSERLIVRQDIIQTENRINFLTGRFPETSLAQCRRARGAASEPTGRPPSRTRAAGCRARREGCSEALLPSGFHRRRRWLAGVQSNLPVRYPRSSGGSTGW